NTLTVTPAAGGLKTYLVEVFRELLEVDHANEYTFLCSPVNRSVFAFAGRFPNATIREVRRHPRGPVARILFDQLAVPRLMAKQTHTVLITPSSVASILVGHRQVTLVVAPLSVRALRTAIPRDRSTITLWQAVYFRLFMPLSMRRSNAVVAISQHLADALTSEYGRPVDVVHAGVDASALPAPLVDEIDRGGDGYVLFVSTLFPYKNVDRLLDAFSVLHARRRVPAGLNLRIVGRDPDGRQLARLQARARALGVSDRVAFLGPIPHDRIWPLYQRARLFVYPSSMETFGVPVLEAMRVGIPVAASRRMSIPEVAGGAAILFDPDDVEDMAQVMARALGDEGLRASLIEAGRRRVQELSWKRSAGEMLAVLTRVADGALRP
ncbi:MAG: glycosyltransferase family 4 protein, partial [Gemmatimonadaceae bacterium]